MEGQSNSSDSDDSSNDSTPPTQFSMKMQRFPNRKINSRSVNFAHNDIINSDDDDDSSFTRSSMASDYVYHKTVEEKKKWDCAVTNVEEAGSASELHMGKKIKIFSIK